MGGREKGEGEGKERGKGGELGRASGCGVRGWKNRERILWRREKVRDEKDYSGLREKTIERDNYRCLGCGITREEHLKKWGVDLNVDHKNKDREDNRPDNLQTLCLRCHGKKDSSGMFLAEWRKNLTEKQK